MNDFIDYCNAMEGWTLAAIESFSKWKVFQIDEWRFKTPDDAKKFMEKVEALYDELGAGW